MKCLWHTCVKDALVGVYCSKQCKNKYNVDKRRKKLKTLAVEYKGGACQICNYSFCIRALEFHHTDPKQKDFNISATGSTYSWNSIKEELNKCVMLCANCHRELHAGLTVL